MGVKLKDVISTWDLPLQAPLYASSVLLRRMNCLLDLGTYIPYLPFVNLRPEVSLTSAFICLFARLADWRIESLWTDIVVLRHRKDIYSIRVIWSDLWFVIDVILCRVPVFLTFIP